MTDEHRDELDQELLASWETPEPPENFAERAAEARARVSQDGEAPRAVAASAGRHRRLIFAGALTAVAAVAAVVAIAHHRSGASGRGVVAADERVEVALAGRGVAVAERGAELTWAVASDGRASVSQSRGDVFYRVEPGGEFVVETPAGTARVTGTCFRVRIVEDEMNKSAIKTGAVGAVLGAAVVVAVYEGRVAFQSSRTGGPEVSVAAGETLTAGPSGVKVADGVGPAAAAADPELEPPAPEASREELLRRDELQRQRIAELERRLSERGEMAGGPRPGLMMMDETTDGRPWFDPGEDQLKLMAAECHLSIDMPPIMDEQRIRNMPCEGGGGDIEAEMCEALRATFLEVLQWYAGELRILYIEATGDADGADELSVGALAREIVDKSGEGADDAARALIASERAGLVQAPADDSLRPPVERYYRLISHLGDETEALLAKRVGANRARAHRAEHNGWGSRMEMKGCAEEPAGQ